MSLNERRWKLKVEITRNDIGSPSIDITDRVIDCNISFDYERRNGSATLTIDNYDYSLSPINRESSQNMVDGIYNPLFDSNHTIKIWEGIMVAGGAYEYVQRFTGVLGDEIDAETFPGTLTLTARDKSKLLQDTYIFQSKSYGSSGKLLGMTLGNVVQDMITEFLPSAGITVSVASGSGQVAVGTPSQPYTAKDTNLWDACQTLVDAFNHELMFFEDGTLLLRKTEKDLHTVTPVATFSENDLVSNSFGMSDADVRNHIMLRVQGLDPIEVKNEDSIARYGRRYMEIRRAMANIITTKEQAHDFVNGLLKEMSWLAPTSDLELPLFPTIQIGDIITVSNTKLGIDPTFDIFRVVGIQESFSATKKRTTMNLKGYVRLDIADTIAPKAPTGLSHAVYTRDIKNYPNSGWFGSTKVTSFPKLLWTPVTQDVNNNPLPPDFGGYTLYRTNTTYDDPNAKWYPIASIKSYIEPLSLSVNYFYDYTAPVGVNSYKIVALNKFGKKSAESFPHTLIVSPIEFL
jgi:hypothetical protein